jgi:hypothetical protein
MLSGMNARVLLEPRPGCSALCGREGGRPCGWQKVLAGSEWATLGLPKYEGDLQLQPQQERVGVVLYSSTPQVPAAAQ